MAQPRATRAVRTPRSDFVIEHERQMQDLIIQTEANARLMSTLTDQVTKLAETVGAMITATHVNQTNISNQSEQFKAFSEDIERRLDGLEGRERTALGNTVQNGFVLGNNAISWLVVIVAAAITALLSGHVGFK